MAKSKTNGAMQKVKDFFANKKVISGICVALALVTVVGVFGAFGGSRGSSGGGGGSSGGSGAGSSTTVTVPRGLRSKDYASLYEQEGLVACYVSYGNENYETDRHGNLIWENHVADGKDATLRNGNGVSWMRNNGGIGYTMTYEQSQANGVGVRCEIPYSLRAVDLTGGVQEYPHHAVEAIVSYTGVTHKNDGSEYTATSPESSFNAFGDYNFRFGYVVSDAYVTNSSTTSKAFTQKWGIFLPDTENGGFALTNMGTDSFSTKLGKVRLMSYHNEWHPDVQIGGSYKFSVFYGSYKSNASINYEMVRAGSGHEWDDDTGVATNLPSFTLLAGLPGTLYSVRYYNVQELPDEVKQRNFFVDLCGFYQIDVSDILDMDTETRETFLVSCGTAAAEDGVELDLANYEANKALVQQIIAEYK